MAIPAGHVAHLTALKQLVLVNEIFEDLVECVADVQIAIGVRRPVMQDELLSSIVLTQALVNGILRPPLQ